MNRRNALCIVPGVLILATKANAIDIGGALGAATDAAKAATLTDDDVRRYASQMAIYADRQAKVAPVESPYGRRLIGLSSGLADDGGLKLNYKCYLTREINAFAMADGTIRLYSGLMDMMTD